MTVILSITHLSIAIDLIFPAQALQSIVADEFLFNADFPPFPLSAPRHTGQLFSTIRLWGGGQGEATVHFLFFF